MVKNGKASHGIVIGFSETGVMVVGKWMRLSGPIPCAIRSWRFFAPILGRVRKHRFGLVRFHPK